jgi:hypothetical protein
VLKGNPLEGSLTVPQIDPLTGVLTLVPAIDPIWQMNGDWGTVGELGLNVTEVEQD